VQKKVKKSKKCQKWSKNRQNLVKKSKTVVFRFRRFFKIDFLRACIADVFSLLALLPGYHTARRHSGNYFLALFWRFWSFFDLFWTFLDFLTFFGLFDNFWTFLKTGFCHFWCFLDFFVIFGCAKSPFLSVFWGRLSTV